MNPIRNPHAVLLTLIAERDSFRYLFDHAKPGDALLSTGPGQIKRMEHQIEEMQAQVTAYEAKHGAPA